MFLDDKMFPCRNKIICYTVRETLSMFPIVILEQFPVRDMEALLEGLISVL